MKTVSLIWSVTTLCLLQLYCVSAQSDEAGNNAIATVTKVTPSIYDEYFQADWDDTAPSGFIVRFEDNLNATFFKNYVNVFMYTADNSTSDRKDFFNGSVCDLFDPNNNKYPKNNYLPRQIMKIILPDRYGSCDIEKGSKPINEEGQVSTEPKNNPDLQFPSTNPFELRVYVLSDLEFFLEKPWDRYIFKVFFDIESIPKPQENEKAYYCLNTQWNYYIVWRVCTIAEFFESIFSGIGRRVIRIF